MIYTLSLHDALPIYLLYGIGESGGFVLLTGEVGTGKTTICRALIEQLPDTVDLALILNPRLSEPELMAAICDEMRIPYPLGTKSLKDFFDFMNRHLLEAHARGRNPVLMIDEAQNLSSEVLELIRLLTNLETAEKKLLQIILVGQPELNHILAQQNHRQTAQRITARYHLMPLGLVETHNYINHRLHVAGLDAHVFAKGAVKAVHKAARGIPRLINSICDRALLAAYVEGRAQVTAKLAKKAAAEVLGTQAMAPGTSVWRSLALALSITGLIFWVGFDPYRTGIKDTLGEWFEPLLPPPAPESSAPETTAKLQPEATPAPEPVSQPEPEPNPEPEPEPEPAAEEPAPNEPAPEPTIETPPVEAGPLDARPVEQLPVEESVPTVDGTAGQDISQPQGTALEALIQSATPDRAYERLFGLWQQSYFDLKGLTPCDKVQGTELSCLRGETDLTGLKAMNRPVVVSLVMPDGEHVYGVVTAIAQAGNEQAITLAFEDRTLTLSGGAFTLRWPGDFVVLWQSPKTIQRALVFGQQGEDVRELRRLLAKAGFGDGPKDIEGSGSVFYGPSLREKIREFQAATGIRVDGIAGPDTVLRMTGMAGETVLPALSAAPSSPIPAQ